jgi:hypothetical protein
LGGLGIKLTQFCSESSLERSVKLEASFSNQAENFSTAQLLNSDRVIINQNQINSFIASYTTSEKTSTKLGFSRNGKYNEASNSQQSVKRSRKETTTDNSSDGPVRNNGSLAPDLLSYLQVTFAEYDTDESGTLDWEEFWKLLQAMNLGVTESDYYNL